MARVKLTQTEYNNLSSKDANTLYLIKDEGKLYKGSNQYLNVYTSPAETLVSIAVTTPPTKISYIEGEPLDLTGLVVTGTYLDGHTADVTDSCTFNPVNGSILAATDTRVTITFGGKSCELTITVVDTKLPVGGKIFYIHSDNGATYKFYDASNNELTTQTVEGLQNAVKYEIISGTPTADKFYVLNTLVGLSSGQWTPNDAFYNTVSYNYIGGGKPATALVLPSLGDTSSTIWYWLKNTANAEDNSTGCTDWYIGSAPNTTEGDDTNTELGKLRRAISSYPSIFSDQATWFSGYMWSTIDTNNRAAFAWDSSYGSWLKCYKNNSFSICAIRSF